MPFLISIIVLLAGAAILIGLGIRYLWVQQRVAERLENDIPLENATSNETDQLFLSGVSGWLFKAGFRGSRAALIFWLSTLGCGMLAGGLFFSIWQRGYFAVAAEFVGSIPGGVGNVLVPFVLAAPWFLMIVFTLIPWLYVRSIRRRRVKTIEKDLPLLLDLLESLANAGIGFDSALDRILASQKKTRPLVKEFRTFQRDNLAGRSRIESLRRLIRRVDVSMFSTFIAAVIQAEQTGSPMSNTLRTQSAEMRARRREKATAAAMSVPTLLVIPMVVGFLPGIFVILLGPMLFQALGLLETSFRGAVGQ